MLCFLSVDCLWRPQLQLLLAARRWPSERLVINTWATTQTSCHPKRFITPRVEVLKNANRLSQTPARLANGLQSIHSAASEHSGRPKAQYMPMPPQSSPPPTCSHLGLLMLQLCLVAACICLHALYQLVQLVSPLREHAQLLSNRSSSRVQQDVHDAQVAKIQQQQQEQPLLPTMNVGHWARHKQPRSR